MSHIIITVLVTIFAVIFGFGICAILTSSKIADLDAEIAQLKEQNKTELAEGYKIGYDEAMETARILMQGKRSAGG
jgi:hypothetical protein